MKTKIENKLIKDSNLNFIFRNNPLYEDDLQKNCSIEEISKKLFRNYDANKK